MKLSPEMIKEIEKMIESILAGNTSVYYIENPPICIVDRESYTMYKIFRDKDGLLEKAKVLRKIEAKIREFLFDLDKSL